MPSPIRFPEELPVSARVRDIAAAVDAHLVVIVAGETGSGKTTQLPKICLAMGRGLEAHIGVTQPRRIAATSVAARVVHFADGVEDVARGAGAGWRAGLGLRLVGGVELWVLGKHDLDEEDNGGGSVVFGRDGMPGPRPSSRDGHTST